MKNSEIFILIIYLYTVIINCLAYRNSTNAIPYWEYKFDRKFGAIRKIILYLFAFIYLYIICFISFILLPNALYKFYAGYNTKGYRIYHFKRFVVYHFFDNCLEPILCLILDYVELNIVSANLNSLLRKVSVIVITLIMLFVCSCSPKTYKHNYYPENKFTSSNGLHISKFDCEKIYSTNKK